MNKIKCIVIDDELQARTLIEIYINKIDILECVHLFDSPKHVDQFIDENQIDLVITDISMPNELGTDFARRVTNKCKVVFTTAFMNYALEAFDIQVLDYLVKPITFSRFEKAMEKAIKQIKLDRVNQQFEKTSSDFLFLRKNNTKHKVYHKDILYVEADNDYVIYNTLYGKFMIKKSLKHALEELQSDLFIRVHKSYVINKSEISLVKGNVVKISNTEIPIGRVYKSNLKT
ncbi:MAG: LytR/AlgR family response regulator transcription factor [Flavobacteriales bacterium]